MKYIVRINVDDDEEFEYLSSYDCDCLRTSLDINHAVLFKSKNEFYNFFSSVKKAKQWLNECGELLLIEDAKAQVLLRDIIC